MFSTPRRTDVKTYFSDVLRDVSSRVGFDRDIVAIKKNTTVRHQVVRGVARKLCPRILILWGEMLNQTLIRGSL